MKERPILFSGPMVRAILDGKKTQTRRVIKDQPLVRRHRMGYEVFYWRAKIATPLNIAPDLMRQFCPYGAPGDTLWIKEALRSTVYNGLACYAEDNEAVLRDGEWAPWQWKRPSLPSMFCPRWASRLTLRVTGVRVERVQDISRADEIAEGVQPFREDAPDELPEGTKFRAFSALWDSINAARGFGWDANPWCWVVEFERVQP